MNASDEMRREQTEAAGCAEETLRDRFAMAALNGMLANGISYGENFLGASQQCYKYADAMLAARQQKATQ